MKNKQEIVTWGVILTAVALLLLVRGTMTILPPGSQIALPTQGSPLPVSTPASTPTPTPTPAYTSAPTFTPQPLVDNNPPIAALGTSAPISVVGGSSVTIDLLGFDPDPDSLSYSIVTPALHGTLQVGTRVNNNQQQYIYVAASNWTGTDFFGFVVNDGKVNSTIYMVAVAISPPPPPPPPPPTTSCGQTTDTLYPCDVHIYSANALKRIIDGDGAYTLQTALNYYGSLRLENGDYTLMTNGSQPISVSAGQKIYGLPWTKIPPIIVAPGTRNALVSRVRTDYLSFPPSNLVTSQNTFRSFMFTEIRVNGGRLVNNTFIDFNYTHLNINTVSGGYVRNNRFIRMRSQSISPQLTMKGDVARSSYGNVFLGFNFLTPQGTTTEILNQGSLSIVGGDAESWNQNHLSDKALFYAGANSLIKIFGMNGGGGQAGIYDISADELHIMGSYLNSNNISPQITLRPSNKRSVIINHDQRSQDDRMTLGSKFTALQDVLGAIPTYNGTQYVGTMPAGSAATLKSILIPAQAGVPWAAPVYAPIPDPGGPNWRTNLGSKPDSTVWLQARINNNEMVATGTYYISAPLQVDHDHMLWGSGASTTLIIAKNSNIDMVVSSAHRDTSANNGVHFTIGEITLQGGRTGIRFDAANTGAYAQVTDSVISHVTLRNMLIAGIYIEGIYAIDNSFFDNLNIVNSNIAVKQVQAAVCQSQDTSGINYIDKVYFYQSQFVGNQIGFDLPACRPNNSNFCINCLFKDNSLTAVRMKGNIAPFFANSDFINNGGTATLPTVSNTVSGLGDTGSWSNNVMIVGSRFRPGAASALIGAYRMDIEGNTFDIGTNPSAKIVAGANNASLYNNTSALPLGSPWGGILVNNSFPAGSIHSNPLVYMQNASSTVLIHGASTGAPQMLISSQSAPCIAAPQKPKGCPQVYLLP